MTGTLLSVDQYLNIKLSNITIIDSTKYPQLGAIKSCFIRGSTIRFIQITPKDVDVELLQDAARKENVR